LRQTPIAAAVATHQCHRPPVWLTTNLVLPRISLSFASAKPRRHRHPASHNPYSWNGIKYKASYGSSALPSIVAQIESELAKVQSERRPSLPPRKE